MEVEAVLFLSLGSLSASSERRGVDGDTSPLAAVVDLVDVDVDCRRAVLDAPRLCVVANRALLTSIMRSIIEQGAILLSDDGDKRRERDAPRSILFCFSKEKEFVAWKSQD